MRVNIAIALACFTVMFADLTWPTQREPGWSGNYECDGTGERGQYRATLAIEQLTKTYRLRWTMESGHRFVGVGLVAGEELAVSYSDFSASVGLAIYAMDDGGVLRGRWTSVGADETFTERCRTRGARARQER